MRVLAIVLLAVAVLAKHEEYIGYKSYYLTPSTREQLVSVRSLQDALELDFLANPTVNREGVVLVKPQYQDEFIKTLQDLGVEYRVHSENVKASLDYDDEQIEARTRLLMARDGHARMPYDNYQPLAVIEDYIDDIARRFPETVTLVTPANSFEGRPIKYLKISTTNFEDESKPVIFIEATIHAREWIAPPTATWTIHKLTENITEPELLEKFDWIVLPVSNPDGYHFSQTTTRFWRKTRSTDQSPTSFLCPGVDGNRNYDFFWNTVGVSSNPCADTYAGSVPFSEIETRVVRDIIFENLHRMALYNTMHSYGSMILYPWGHDGSLSNNAFGLHVVGVDMVDAIQAVAIPYFPNYVVGNSVLVIGYPASGASEDYAHSIGVPFSYTYELPGLSGGFEGFHLPPQYIQQVCYETWDGIVAGAKRAGELYTGIIVP